MPTAGYILQPSTETAKLCAIKQREENSMIIGVLKEIKDNEYRVAAVPETVAEIVAHGHAVLVEKDAGLGSGYSDADYAAAGAEVLDTAAEV